jgi:hypothetical protein
MAPAKFLVIRDVQVANDVNLRLGNRVPFGKFKKRLGNRVPFGKLKKRLGNRVPFGKLKKR